MSSIIHTSGPAYIEAATSFQKQKGGWKAIITIRLSTNGKRQHSIEMSLDQAIKMSNALAHRIEKIQSEERQLNEG